MAKLPLLMICHCFRNGLSPPPNLGGCRCFLFNKLASFNTPQANYKLNCSQCGQYPIKKTPRKSFRTYGKKNYCLSINECSASTCFFSSQQIKQQLFLQQLLLFLLQLQLFLQQLQLFLQLLCPNLQNGRTGSRCYRRMSGTFQAC